MSNQNIKDKFKGILLFTVAFTILLFLPLRGDEAETRQVSEKKEATIAECSSNSSYLIPLEKRLFLELKLIKSINMQPKFPENPFPLTPKLIETRWDTLLTLKIPAKSQQTENSLFTVSLITLALLNVADYLSTTQALKYEGLEEGNPLMKPFVKNPLVYTTVKLGLTAFNYHLLKSLYRKDKKLAWIITTLTNFAFSYVVVNNIRKINEAKKM